MSDAAAAQRFYGRWARLYDLLATHAPGVSGFRGRAADALDLRAGDTVLDVGCGTGANLPHLRERVGPEGRVVGVDFTPGVLARARDRIDRAGWANVDVVRGDATALPIAGPVDGVLASFLVGMLDDPAAGVGDWIDLLAPGGRVALLDAASSPRRVPALDLGFRAFVRLGAPGGLRRSEGGPRPIDVLDRRVAAAHGAVGEHAALRVDERAALGFVRLTAGERSG